jgi:hypothetical protein
MCEIPASGLGGIAGNCDGVRHTIPNTRTAPRPAVRIEQVHQPGTDAEPGQHSPAIVNQHVALRDRLGA